MRPALVLMCSPHAGGVSDLLAETFAAGLEAAGWPAERLALREHPVRPCTGCGFCAQPPHVCVLADEDEAEWLFARFAEAPLVLLASPIFFYALPATFKAWIDRGQRFWMAQAVGGAGAPASVAPLAGAKPVLAAFAAGRPRGEELFSGALRTLSWFASTLGARLEENCVFRGLDRREDLSRRPEDMAAMREWGRAWAPRLDAAASLPPEAPPR